MNCRFNVTSLNAAGPSEYEVGGGSREYRTGWLMHKHLPDNGKTAWCAEWFIAVVDGITCLNVPRMQVPRLLLINIRLVDLLKSSDSSRTTGRPPPSGSSLITLPWISSSMLLHAYMHIYFVYNDICNSSLFLVNLISLSPGKKFDVEGLLRYTWKHVVRGMRESPPRIAGDTNAGSGDERGENSSVIVCMINPIACIHGEFLMISNTE